MLSAPKVPWRYRVVALAIALAIGALTFQIYVAGAKFAGAVTNYLRIASQIEAAKAAKHKPAAPDMKNEPGVVPVSIIPQKNDTKDDKKN